MKFRDFWIPVFPYQIQYIWKTKFRDPEIMLFHIGFQRFLNSGEPIWNSEIQRSCFPEIQRFLNPCFNRFFLEPISFFCKRVVLLGSVMKIIVKGALLHVPDKTCRFMRHSELESIYNTQQQCPILNLQWHQRIQWFRWQLSTRYSQAYQTENRYTRKDFIRWDISRSWSPWHQFSGYLQVSPESWLKAIILKLIWISVIYLIRPI